MKLPLAYSDFYHHTFQNQQQFLLYVPFQYDHYDVCYLGIHHFYFICFLFHLNYPLFILIQPYILVPRSQSSFPSQFKLHPHCRQVVGTNIFRYPSVCHSYESRLWGCRFSFFDTNSLLFAAFRQCRALDARLNPLIIYYINVATDLLGDRPLNIALLGTSYLLCFICNASCVQTIIVINCRKLLCLEYVRNIRINTILRYLFFVAYPSSDLKWYVLLGKLL